MGPRTVASAAWALGALLGRQATRRRQQPNLSDLYPEPETGTSIDVSSGSSSAGAVDGVTTAGRGPPAALPPIVAVVFARVHTLLPVMDAHGLANVAWAAAGLGLLSPHGANQPGGEAGKGLMVGNGGGSLMAELLAAAQPQLRKFSAHDLAMLLHALAPQQRWPSQGSGGDGSAGGSSVGSLGASMGRGGASEQQVRAFASEWMKAASSCLHEFSPQVRVLKPHTHT